MVMIGHCQEPLDGEAAVLSWLRRAQVSCYGNVIDFFFLDRVTLVVRPQLDIGSVVLCLFSLMK